MALNKPFSKGFFVKARLHLLEGHEPHRRRRLGHRRLERPEPAVQELRPGGLRPDPRLPARASWPSCRSGRTGRASLNAIVKNWSVNGVFSAFTGTPFTRHRLRRLAQRAGQQRSTPTSWAPPTRRATSARTPPTTTRARGRRSPRSVPAPRAATPCAARAGGTSTCRSSASSRSGRSSPCEARVEAFNLTNTPHFNNPNGNVNSGGFMTITGTSGNSPERQFRLGLRMQF